jgi:hypothetical protein
MTDKDLTPPPSFFETNFNRLANQVIYYTNLLLERPDINTIIEAHQILHTLKGLFEHKLRSKNPTVRLLNHDLQTYGSILLGQLEFLLEKEQLSESEKLHHIQNMKRTAEKFLKEKDLGVRL